MNAIQRAIELIKSGKPYDLAIHIASQETGIPTKVISNQFLHKKQIKQKPKQAKKTYQSTLPAWVQQQNEQD